jgi:hypothetical protein
MSGLRLQFDAALQSLGILEVGFGSRTVTKRAWSPHARRVCRPQESGLQCWVSWFSQPCAMSGSRISLSNPTCNARKRTARSTRLRDGILVAMRESSGDQPSGPSRKTARLQCVPIRGDEPDAKSGMVLARYPAERFVGPRPSVGWTSDSAALRRPGSRFSGVPQR